MAKILCLTSGLTGIANAGMALTRRMEQHGHEVVFASPRPLGDLAKANGLDYLQLPVVNFFPAPEVPPFKGPLQRLRRWTYKLRYRSSRRKAAVQALGMDHFREVLKELSPDLVLVDIELHEHLMTSYTEGVPTILLSQWFSLWPQAGLPPLLHTTVPGVGWRGSALGIRWAWVYWRWQRWWMFGKKSLRTLGTHRRAILRQYAKQIGFPQAYMRENYWPGPFTYRELSVASMTLAEMEFPHEPRPGLTYIGPQLDVGRVQPQVDSATRTSLETLFARKAATDTKLICCTVSTFKAGDQQFLQRLVAAVTSRPDWTLVIGLGAKLAPESLGLLPDNVFAFPWIPQLQVLAQADCSINHGGIHTINECIHFRVPMLVYSGKRSDQNGCAARVHYHQLGLMADKDRDAPTAIAQKIDHVLNSLVIRESLAKMHQHYRAYAENDIVKHYLDDFQASVGSVRKDEMSVSH